jgi:hypothetical protein
MKLVTPKKVVRIDIKGGKGNSRCLTVEETNLEECVQYLKDLLAKIRMKIDIQALVKMKTVTISCFEVENGKRIKNKSISAYGMTADQIHSLIIKSLEITNKD